MEKKKRKRIQSKAAYFAFTTNYDPVYDINSKKLWDTKTSSVTQ